MSEITKRVLVMSGLPGSGKTTMARRLYREADPMLNRVLIVSADDHFMRDGVYRFDPAMAGRAHQACWREFYGAVSRDVDLVLVDNTNLTAAEIAPYVLPAEVKGYTVKVLRVGCDPATAYARQTHGVPSVAFGRMLALWEKRDVMPWWDVEDLAPEAAGESTRGTT